MPPPSCSPGISWLPLALPISGPCCPNLGHDFKAILTHLWVTVVVEVYSAWGHEVTQPWGCWKAHSPEADGNKTSRAELAWVQMCNCSHQCPSAVARIVPTRVIRRHVCFLSAEEIGCERWVLSRYQYDVTQLHWSAEMCGGKQLILSMLLICYWMIAFAPLCVSNRGSGDTGSVSPTFLIHHVLLLHLLLHSCVLKSHMFYCTQVIAVRLAGF